MHARKSTLPFQLFRPLAWGGLFLFPIIAFSVETPAELAPIVVEGSSADALLFDPIVKNEAQEVKPNSSNGSVIRQLEESLPVPMTDFGPPGTTAQFRGIGRTVEDTNVQALGVPLNPVIGGGFDFSTFPQFFWSDLSFHLGPSTAGFDPRSSTATLSLMPWTAQAIQNSNDPQNPPSSYRFTEMVTRGLNQVSVAGQWGPAALLVGESDFNSQGVTGSASVEAYCSDRAEIAFHLLATSLDNSSPSSTQFPSDARLKTNRWIPIGQANFKLGEGVLLKESAYYDHNSVRYIDELDPFNDSYDRSLQFGSETALLFGDWTLGLSLRKTEFVQVAGDAPDEEIAHLQLSRVLRAGISTSELRVQEDWMNVYGFRPGAMAGERLDFTPSWGIFAKIFYSSRYPTLQDRYYNSVTFAANPGLGIEEALSFNFGNQWKISSDFEDTEQVFLQYRYNAQVLQYAFPQGFTVVNGGSVHELSYLDELKWHVTSFFDGTNGLRLSSSHVQNAGDRIPYDPLFTDAIGLAFHEASDRPAWSAGADYRVVSSSSAAPGSISSGYGWMDLQAEAALLKNKNLSIQMRIDNLFDRRVEVVQSYPWPGRLYSLGLMATL